MDLSIEWILGIVGALGGTGGLISMYNAKANRETIVVSNMQKVIDEVREHCTELKKHHNQYVDETNSRFEQLEKRISKMQLKDQIKQSAINSAYKCNGTLGSGDICPVIKTMNECENILEAEINKVKH